MNFILLTQFLFERKGHALSLSFYTTILLAFLLCSIEQRENAGIRASKIIHVGGQWIMLGHCKHLQYIYQKKCLIIWQMLLLLIFNLSKVLTYMCVWHFLHLHKVNLDSLSFFLTLVGFSRSSICPSCLAFGLKGELILDYTVLFINGSTNIC